MTDVERRSFIKYQVASMPHFFFYRHAFTVNHEPSELFHGHAPREVGKEVRVAS